MNLHLRRMDVKLFILMLLLFVMTKLSMYYQMNSKLRQKKNVVFFETIQTCDTIFFNTIFHYPKICKIC